MRVDSGGHLRMLDGSLLQSWRPRARPMEHVRLGPQSGLLVLKPDKDLVWAGTVPEISPRDHLCFASVVKDTTALDVHA
jgi:hypothetical protein